MSAALNMDFVGLPRSQALVSDIEREAGRLESRHPDVTDVNVTVEERAPRKYERKQYNVRLGVRTGERQLFVNREHDHDPNAAVREAFEAAVRQLSAPS